MKKNLICLAVILTILACGGDDVGGGDAPSGGSEYLNAANVEIPC